MSFLDGLNSAQIKAVNHHNGPLLVVAGAGSGKTRALTHRIAHLISAHDINPLEILAVTFTNKAAKEMKERLETLLANQLSTKQFGQPWSTLPHVEKRLLKDQIYQEVTKGLWIGTFHSLFSKLLRFDIDKFKDKEGLKWTNQFSIYDESDSLKLIKEIVTQDMGLDPKRFEPKKIRWAISKAKNQGLLPHNLEESADNPQKKLLAEAYKDYRKSLAANNSLDFDDLLLLPVQLLQQNEQVRLYWHNRFKHLLVDEYQDTNRTQYELIKLLVTNGEDPSKFKDWSNRSIFAVGDADQSIYSFRAADFRILMGFQEDFGDGSLEEETETMVKLEDNYRSSSTILEAANSLIENNTERIKKTLRATKGSGELIRITRCDDEIAEAESVVHQLRLIEAGDQSLRWGDMAILYRTNAQSRVIEESLVRWRIPYSVIGGLRFYDRREIKDILAYLRLLLNSADNVGLLRVLNVPKRGIGKTTIERISDAASQLGIPLWDIISDVEAVRSLSGRSAKGVLEFRKLILNLKDYLRDSKPSDIIQRIIEETGYLDQLIKEGNEISEERRRNLQELINATLQYEEENESPTIEDFLSSACLASDADNKDLESNRVILMTLHSSKGLEFPIVSLVGMEQGLFPTYRSLSDPSTLEEERRLCYVGLTRAKERLLLSHANERRLWGGAREPAIPSLFLSEIPNDLIKGDIPLNGGTAIRREDRLNRTTSINRKDYQGSKPSTYMKNANTTSSTERSWQVGDKIMHNSFGEGKISHTFGSGGKLTIAVKFSGMGPKIIDPRLAPIELIE